MRSVILTLLLGTFLSTCATSTFKEAKALLKKEIKNFDTKISDKLKKTECEEIEVEVPDTSSFMARMAGRTKIEKQVVCPE